MELEIIIITKITGSKAISKAPQVVCSPSPFCSKIAYSIIPP